MPRDRPIRITKNDREEYARLVRNTKAKVRRTIKNYGIDLSDEINLPPIEEFKTRKQLNEFKEKQRMFTSRSNLKYQFKKNEYGVVASKRELLDIEMNNKKAQRLAKEKIKEMENKPFISGGREQGTVGQRMKQMNKPNAAGIVVPPDFNFEKVRNRQQLEQKKENVERRANENYFDERMERMKQNYIRLLSDTFNSDANPLIELLEGVPSDDFYEMYQMYDEFDFSYPYIKSTDDVKDFIGRLTTYVERYYRGEMNMDLKPF